MSDTLPGEDSHRNRVWETIVKEEETAAKSTGLGKFLWRIRRDRNGGDSRNQYINTSLWEKPQCLWMETGETKRVAREGDEQGLLEVSWGPQRAVFSPELQLTVAPNTQAQNDHIFLATASGTPLFFCLLSSL